VVHLDALVTCTESVMRCAVLARLFPVDRLVLSNGNGMRCNGGDARLKT
jgi:hypothetical protein